MARANTYELEHGGYFWGDSKCKICGSNKGTVYRLFYYPTFMNGDAEVEADFCELHKGEGRKLEKELMAPIIAEQKRQDENSRRYEERQSNKLQADLKTLQEKGHMVRDLNGMYQLRINGALDIYPQSQSYHDIKKNRRGQYRNLVGFVVNFFETPKTPVPTPLP